MPRAATIRRLREELRRKTQRLAGRTLSCGSTRACGIPGVLHRGGPPDYMYTQQVLNNILRDDARLEKLTSYDVELSGDIFGRFARKLEDWDATTTTPPLRSCQISPNAPRD